MSIVGAIVLGLIQGLTEFLPVSSSGHLVLGQRLLGFTEPEILFDVILHLGTLTAVFVVFFQEIIGLAWEAVHLPVLLFKPSTWAASWRNRPNLRMLAFIIAGSVPTGLIGLFFKDSFESLFGSPLAVGVALVFTGIVLLGTSMVKTQGRNLSRFRILDAVAVGLAQGLAITPGISRSGLTISTALFMGVDREVAARYSFLLSIPAIVGALALELHSAGASQIGLLEFGLGFLAALFSGLMALALLLRIVKKGKLHYFGFYCLPLGIITIFASVWG
ncbi:MAG: undecaprenyl-diphosphate phosphatase [Pseudomonadota bacterium]